MKQKINKIKSWYSENFTYFSREGLAFATCLLIVIVLAGILGGGNFIPSVLIYLVLSVILVFIFPDLFKNFFRKEAEKYY